MDIRTAPLGHTFTPYELNKYFKAIYGGIGWPGKRPGFVVVLGMGQEKVCGKYIMYLLDEFESMHLLKLVRHCGALDFKYRPRRWIGNPDNGSADRFIDEMNAETWAHSEDPNGEKRFFHVSSTFILDIAQNPYEYMVGTVKAMLNEKCRQLHLKDESQTKGYLSSIEGNEVAELEFGAYPAIEALAFAAIELRDHGEAIDRPRPRRPKVPRSAFV